jgi:cytoskeletal protein RodZ
MEFFVILLVLILVSYVWWVYRQSISDQAAAKNLENEIKTEAAKVVEIAKTEVSTATVAVEETAKNVAKSAKSAKTAATKVVKKAEDKAATNVKAAKTAVTKKTKK